MVTAGDSANVRDGSRAGTKAGWVRAPAIPLEGVRASVELRAACQPRLIEAASLRTGRCNG